MKKTYIVTLALILFSVITAQGILALMIPTNIPPISLVQKDPNTWNVIDNGIYGEAIFSIYYFPKPSQKIKSRIRANAWGLEPKTKYTLIYYGYMENNDVWPYATCITSGKTSSKGFVRMQSGNFDFIPFLDDGKNQKFWIVKSEDVDCKNHMMTNWNPNKYLFETSFL